MNDCHLFTSSDFEKNIFSLSFIGIKFVALVCFKINTELEGDEKIRFSAGTVSAIPAAVVGILLTAAKPKDSIKHQT